MSAGGLTQIFSLSLTVSSMSLGALALITLGVGLVSECKDAGFQDKQVPLAMSIFICFLAYGTWRLRDRVMEGLGILDTLPEFATTQVEGLPAQVGEWNNWFWKWLLGFCGLVGGGVLVLELYAIQPLQRDCPPPEKSSSSLLTTVFEVRRIIYAILAVITIVPLLLAASQSSKWAEPYKAAQRAAAKRLAFEQRGSGRGLSERTGGYTMQGSTRLFDATFRVAQLVGYAGGHDSHAEAPALHNPHIPSEAL